MTPFATLGSKRRATVSYIESLRKAGTVNVQDAIREWCDLKGYELVQINYISGQETVTTTASIDYEVGFGPHKGLKATGTLAIQDAGDSGGTVITQI